jgi:hypothetical protein
VTQPTQQQDEPTCGVECADPHGPCDRCARLATEDLAAIPELHARLGASSAIVGRTGSPRMGALNLRGPAAPGPVTIRLVPVWQTRRVRRTAIICAGAGAIAVESAPPVLLPIPDRLTWERAPVVDGHGDQVLVPDGDQHGTTPLAGLLSDWVDDAREVLGLAGPRGRSVTAMAEWLSLQMDRLLRRHPDPAGLCAEIRRAVHAARRLLDDYDPRPTLLPGITCPSCDRLTLWQMPGEDRIECGSCETRYLPDDERITDQLPNRTADTTEVARAC